MVFTDYIFSCNVIDSLYTENNMSFYGKSGYLRTIGDSVIRANLIKGYKISYGNFNIYSSNISVTGNVKSINYTNPEDNFIIVDSNIPLDTSLVGSYIHILNSDKLDNSYLIKKN